MHLTYRESSIKMARTRTHATIFLALILCAFLASQTEAHLRIGKRIPAEMELPKRTRKFYQDRMQPRLRENGNWLDKRPRWKPRMEKTPELYRDQTKENY